MESEIERILTEVAPSSLDTTSVLNKEESPKTADNIETNTESNLEDVKENVDKERRETLVRLAEDGQKKLREDFALRQATKITSTAKF